MEEVKVKVELGGESPKEFQFTLTGSQERIEQFWPSFLALANGARAAFDAAPTVSEATPCRGCGDAG